MENSKEKQFQDENPLGEDKRRFRPLKAIRRMFRDGRKAMGMSHIFRGNVDLASTSNIETTRDEPLFRSFSHESVFTGGRVEEAKTFTSKPAPTPRDVEVENKPMPSQPQLAPSSKLFQTDLTKKLMTKNALVEEPTTLSMSAPSYISPLAQAILSNRDKLLKDVALENETKRKESDVAVPETTEELNAATPLNNSAAYDKIAVRPKNRRRKTTKYLETDNDTRNPWNISKDLELLSLSESINTAQATSSVDGEALSSSLSERRKSEESIKNAELSDHQISVKKSHSFKSPFGDAVVPSLDDVKSVHLRQTNSGATTPSSKTLDKAKPLNKVQINLSVPNNGSIGLETDEVGENGKKETISQKESEKNTKEKELPTTTVYRKEKLDVKKMAITPKTNKPESKPVATTPAMKQLKAKPIAATPVMKQPQIKTIVATPTSEPATPVESEFLIADKSPFKVKMKKESSEESPKINEEANNVEIDYRDILSALKPNKTFNAEKVVKIEDNGIPSKDQFAKENSSRKATTQNDHQNSFEKLEERKVSPNSQDQETKEKNNKIEMVGETSNANNPWKNVLKQKSLERKPDSTSEKKQELAFSASKNKIPRAKVPETDAKPENQSSPKMKQKNPLIPRRPVKQLSNDFIKIHQSDQNSVTSAEVKSPVEPEAGETTENSIFSVKLRKVQHTDQDETQQNSQNAGFAVDAKKTTPDGTLASTQRGDSCEGEKSRSLVSDEQSVKINFVSPPVVMRSKSNRVATERTNAASVEDKRSSTPSWVSLAHRHTERYKHGREEQSHDKPTEEPPAKPDKKVSDEKENTSSNLVIKPPDWITKNNKTKSHAMNKSTSLDEPLEKKKEEKLKHSLSTPATSASDSGPPSWLAIAQSRQKRWPGDETV